MKFIIPTRSRSTRIACSSDACWMAKSMKESSTISMANVSRANSNKIKKNSAYK